MDEGETRESARPATEFLVWFCRLRADAGFSLRELATRSELSKNTLWRAFQGPTLPKRHIVQKVAQACGADEVDWVYYWNKINTIQTTGRTASAEELRPPWDTEDAATAIHSPPLLAYDPRDDGLFVVGEWSAHRQLETASVESLLVPRPAQPFVDEALLRSATSRRVNDTGEDAYLVGFKIDHRESTETNTCRFRFAASSYSEARAVEELRARHPDSLVSADAAVAKNATSYLAHAIPSLFAVNVIVVSARGTLLCARRSSAVDNAIGMWTLGIYETLKLTDVTPGGNVLERLVRRGLKEEVGLLNPDYSQLRVTWLGIYAPLLRGHAVAIVRSHLDENEIHSRARTSESSYEHDMLDWIPFNRATLTALASARELPRQPKVAATFQALDRTWLEQAQLAISELERWNISIGAQ